MADNENNQQQKEEEKVSREAYEKALKEKKNYAELADSMKLQLKAFEEKVKALSENELKVKEDYKTLSEQKTKEALDYKTELETLKTTIVNGTKENALKSELAKLGADGKVVNELIRLAKLEALKYDEEHKVVLGAEEEAKRLKEVIPPAFIKVAPKADHSAGGEFKTISIDDFKKMSSEERSKVNVADLFAAKGIQVRR